MKYTKTQLAMQMYEQACVAMLNVFCKKHDLTFDFWINDDIGGVAVCSDMYFAFHDIITDISYEAKKFAIIGYVEGALELHQKGEDVQNYYSYIKNNYQFFNHSPNTGSKSKRV